MICSLKDHLQLDCRQVPRDAVSHMEVVASRTAIQVLIVGRGTGRQRGVVFPANAFGRAAIRAFFAGLPFVIRVSVAGVGALDLALEMCKKSFHSFAVLGRVDRG